jgi:hypothetical protein
MTAMPRPKFQRQGPASNCKIDGLELGWVSCTAYAMAMGIDAATAGARRPSGAKVRKLTDDTEGGLKLRQVADVALETYGVRVAVRTGWNTIAPARAAQLLRSGRGFLLQGNTEALLGTKSQSTIGPCNHAVWVNEVKGGTDDRPDKALVYDPAADGRHRVGRDFANGPRWWPWERVLDFAADLRPDREDGPRLGKGKLYAGFVPRRPDTPEAPDAGDSDVVLRPGASRTKPFPDRVRTNVRKGHRINIRSRPDRLRPGDILDRVPDGALFIAFQRLKDGATPPGGGSSIWFGNRDGTEWIHRSGLRRIGGQRGPGLGIGVAPTDADDDPEDLVEGAEDLPEDVRDGDASIGEPPDESGGIPDTDVDADVVGSPEDDVINDEDDE